MPPWSDLDTETLRAQKGDRAATDAVLRKLQPAMLRLVARFSARTQGLGSLGAELESAGWNGLLLGIAGTNATAVVNYWIGSSAGSQAKDATIAAQQKGP